MALTTWRVLIKAMRPGGNLCVDEEYKSSGQHRDEPFIQYTTRIIHDQGGIRMSLSTYIRFVFYQMSNLHSNAGTSEATISGSGNWHLWLNLISQRRTLSLLLLCLPENFECQNIPNCWQRCSTACWAVWLADHCESLVSFLQVVPTTRSDKRTRHQQVQRPQGFRDLQP